MAFPENSHENRKSRCFAKNLEKISLCVKIMKMRFTALEVLIYDFGKNDKTHSGEQCNPGDV